MLAPPPKKSLSSQNLRTHGQYQILSLLLQDPVHGSSQGRGLLPCSPPIVLTASSILSPPLDPLCALLVESPPSRPLTSPAPRQTDTLAPVLLVLPRCSYRTTNSTALTLHCTRSIRTVLASQPKDTPGLPAPRFYSVDLIVFGPQMRFQRATSYQSASWPGSRPSLGDWSVVRWHMR